MVISGYTVSSKSAWAIMRSQKMEGGGIEIIIAIYTKASHGAIQCLISCCHLFPWVEKKKSSLPITPRKRAALWTEKSGTIRGRHRERKSEVKLIKQKEGGSCCFRIQMAAHMSGLLGHLFCSGGHRRIPESLDGDWRGIQLVCIPWSQEG